MQLFFEKIIKYLTKRRKYGIIWYLKGNKIADGCVADIFLRIKFPKRNKN